MTTLVHITNLENEKSIRRSGIKPNDNNIVYFMPHTKEFLVSHQWARELKRSGIKNFAAVDFKLPSKELIWFGKYSSKHEYLELGKAVSIFINLSDTLGYEFFIERKIEPKEILKIRKIEKPMGWRYQPNAHGKMPCSCPMCIQRGGFKTNKLKEKNDSKITRMQAKAIINDSDDPDELAEALRRLQGKWRRESPKYLERLLSNEDEYVLYELVRLISEYRSPLSKKYLEILANSNDEDSKSLAMKYLQKYK